MLLIFYRKRVSFVQFIDAKLSPILLCSPDIFKADNVIDKVNIEFEKVRLIYKFNHEEVKDR